MTVAELIQALKEFRPETKVEIITGQGFHEIETTFFSGILSRVFITTSPVE